MLEFLGAQQRHGRRGDSADFHHREPAGGHHRIVRRAQQHAVAGAPGRGRLPARWRCGWPFLQVGIGPAHIRRLDAEAVSAPFGNMLVEHGQAQFSARGTSVPAGRRGTPAAVRVAADCLRQSYRRGHYGTFFLCLSGQESNWIPALNLARLVLLFDDTYARSDHSSLPHVRTQGRCLAAVKPSRPETTSIDSALC
jgi:hypothetical protein